jgi:phage shock protein E
MTGIVSHPPEGFRSMMISLLVAAAAAATMPMSADQTIDYAGFARLTREVGPERAQRRIDFARFKAMAANENAIILDARSATAFAAGHIDGAVNLPLTDFTAETLAAVLPDRTRPVLIYCNNNFLNNRFPVALKSAPVSLNIQTFINLTAYGYRNVWELGERIDFNDPSVGWVKALGSVNSAS